MQDSKSICELLIRLWADQYNQIIKSTSICKIEHEDEEGEQEKWK